MQYTSLFVAMLLPAAFGLTLQKVPRNDVAAHITEAPQAKRAPAVETAGEWDTDDDDAVAYAWYEEEGGKQH
ncbi:hypothetical protein F4819DRAFT_364468 [Hypoxylon fuscum]|nr:hypothetical protein F4819DRAFT_364468 [Hypoxylon fuscum]